MLSSSFNNSTASKLAMLCLLIGAFIAISSEAKLLRRSRYYDDYDSSPYGSMGGATGERAILTVRGTRNPYDGSAPSKIAIEDQPHRGPYPRGVYDRLNGGRHERYPMNAGALYPGGFRPDPYGYGQGPYNSNFGNSYGNSMYGAPNRIAVTGAFPYGYGSRY